MPLTNHTYDGVGFDWKAAYMHYWFVFYVAAFVAGFTIKCAHGWIRRPYAAANVARVFGATSCALALCDAFAVPAAATGWVAMNLLLTNSHRVPHFSFFGLATMCVVAGSIRSLIERRIIRSLQGRRVPGVSLPFLLPVNTVAMALALTALYWWIIWTSPTGGKGI